MNKIPGWLREFLLKHDDEEKANIVIENLENDAAISNDTWEKFCIDLEGEIRNFEKKRGNKRSNISEFVEEIFKRVCDRYSLEGPGARIPKDILALNQVLSVRLFISHALARKDSRKRYPAIPEAEMAIIKDFRKKDLSEQQDKLKNFDLGKPGSRCTWAFFPAPQVGLNKCSDPIDDPRVQVRPDILNELLGRPIEEGEAREGIVSLRYPVKVPKVKKVPLAISAGFNHRFKPADDLDPPFGWTYDRKNQEKGFPEILHENLKANHISFPVRLIRFARKD